MLAHSVAQQYHMAGVRTAETNAEFEGLSQTRLDFFIRVTSVLIIAAILESSDENAHLHLRHFYPHQKFLTNYFIIIW